ncbi:MAG: response regulator [Elusimicrobia bacterium]|nr:response regulator [Elusimicrobiota bacterium]
MPDSRRVESLLIVDDERDLVEPLLLRLRRAGLRVGAAYDGAAGLRQARRQPPDAVLLDLSMPEMDGWELCRRLREDPRTRSCRLIIMTAWVTRDLERRALAEGAERLLLKPFEDGDLAEALGLAAERGRPPES